MLEFYETREIERTDLSAGNGSRAAARPTSRAGDDAA